MKVTWTIPDLQPVLGELWRAFARRTDEGPRRWLFTAPDARAGTTLVTAAAAMSLARNGRRPLVLVEANLARPGLADYLGCTGRKGLSDLLDGDATLEESLIEVEGRPELRFIHAGNGTGPGPGELETDRGRELLRSVYGAGDTVLIDAPPILESPDAQSLLRGATGIVIVVNARARSRALAQSALKSCEDSGVPVLGCVLNRFDATVPFGLDGWQRPSA